MSRAARTLARGLNALCASVFALGVVTGCGDDDAGDDDVASGTCDSSELDGQCTEVTSAPNIVEGERDFCMQIGGTWTDDPCPTGPTLVGCCYSTVAGEWRDCVYVGGPTGAEETCVAFGDEWRPGSR